MDAVAFFGMEPTADPRHWRLPVVPSLCSGLGALFALYKAANTNHDGVTLRLVNPRPSIQQLFELTQLHQLFEIARR